MNTAQSGEPIHGVLRADAARASARVSPTLFGLFYEDLNRACDGGLNGNVIANHTFDGTYLDRRLHNDLIAMVTKRHARTEHDPTRHWQILQGSITIHRDGGIAAGHNFARIKAHHGAAVIRNGGYQPTGSRNVAAIGVTAGVDMLLSAWVDARTFTGVLRSRLVQEDGNVLGEAVVFGAEREGWQQVSAVIPVNTSGRVHFELTATGEGEFALDEVSLVRADSWGAGDARWSQGVFRRDLVETLADLHPTFMRFPGGCVVEGLDGRNSYSWKNTVGPLHTRQADYNLWGLRVPDGDYSQSNQIGYYEFFLLCEDLDMAPMPVVPAGIACQFRSRDCIRHGHPDFEAIVQDVLDLIDWATGDPATSPWAALRADAGHPEPFPLTYLGIGNENYGPAYFENYAKIRDAVHAHNPNIIPVLSAGPFAQGKAFDAATAFATNQPGPVLLDEHFYKSPAWFIEHTSRYDTYPRGDAKVFVGEYAARAVTAKTTPNTFESALAEAAFLTGIERNADVVAMTSYAPMLNNVGSRLWPHNLIDFNPDTVLPTVNYEVQKLFGTTVGELIVPVEGDLPDGVFASSTYSGERQNIKIVNTTDTAVNLQLHVPGVIDGSHRFVRLATDPDATNSLDFEGHGAAALEPTCGHLGSAGGGTTVLAPAHSITSLDLTHPTV